jgi:hypothetical protein
MNMFSTSLVALCFASPMALALGSGAGQQPVAPTVSNLSFADLQAACLNPAKFHNQAAPKNIQISCQDSQTSWVPDVSSTLSMTGQREITASIISDKYSSAAVSSAVPLSSATMACPQFKQVTNSIQVIQATSCDELVAFTGTSVDFCVAAANALRISNPQAVTEVATGQTVSLCSAAATTPAQQGQQGQQGQKGATTSSSYDAQDSDLDSDLN